MQWEETGTQVRNSLSVKSILYLISTPLLGFREQEGTGWAPRTPAARAEPQLGKSILTWARPPVAQSYPGLPGVAHCLPPQSYIGAPGVCSPLSSSQVPLRAALPLPAGMELSVPWISANSFFWATSILCRDLSKSWLEAGGRPGWLG